MNSNDHNVGDLLLLCHSYDKFQPVIGIIKAFDKQKNYYTVEWMGSKGIALETETFGAGYITHLKQLLEDYKNLPDRKDTDDQQNPRLP